MDLDLNNNTAQSLDSSGIPITHTHTYSHHQSHLESFNIASDQADQAETFEDKLQIKKKK
jgi:hypothetical protein